MSLFGDAYGLYVLAAYVSAAAILAALIWSSVAASRRARRELDSLERERRK